MPKQSPLDMLLDLAHTRVDEATKHLGMLIASEHACEVKLDMLLQYRDEYRQRFMQTAREGIGPDAWRNYSAFINKLDEAITQQEKQVEHSKHLAAAGKQQWISERNRMKAFDTLSAREHAKAAQKEHRQEQRQSDEHGAKRFRDDHQG